MATPSKYGYNYHKPKREIVVMFTNWTLSTGGPTLQDGQISYTEFLGATLNLDEAQRFRMFPRCFFGWESMAISPEDIIRNHHYDTLPRYYGLPLLGIIMMVSSYLNMVS